MYLYEIEGTYGSELTPCNVFCYEQYSGKTWYAVEGSDNVNMSAFSLFDQHGVDVETIEDIDHFSWPDGVNSLDELEKAVDE